MAKNPANQLIGRLSHFLQAGFYPSQVVGRISEPSTVGADPNLILLDDFQLGWNHQLVDDFCVNIPHIIQVIRAVFPELYPGFLRWRLKFCAKIKLIDYSYWYVGWIEIPCRRLEKTTNLNWFGFAGDWPVSNSYSWDIFPEECLAETNSIFVVQIFCTCTSVDAKLFLGVYWTVVWLKEVWWWWQGSFKSLALWECPVYK